MDNLIPHHTKTNKSTKSVSSSPKCVAPWSEFPDDNTEGIKPAEESFWNHDYATQSGDSSVGSPFKGADMPVCNDFLWRDYGQKQRCQEARSLSSSSQSTSSATSSPWHRHAQTVTSFDKPGAPWYNREHVKFPISTIRKLTPIDAFWLRPEYCYDALIRMACEVKDLETVEPPEEEEEPETSFWSVFQPSASSSPKTTSPASALCAIKEQDEDEDYDINDYESNNMVVAPPPTLASPSQQDQLKEQDNDQEYVNLLELNDILDNVEENTTDPATAYENEEVGQECITSPDDTPKIDLKQVDEKDLIEFSVSPEPAVISNVQDQVVVKEPKLVDDDQEEKVLGLLNDKVVEQEERGVHNMQEQEMDSLVKYEQLDVSSSKQEPKATVMNEGESPYFPMEQRNPQLTTYKEPPCIVVKLSDIIQASYQPKVKLSDLIEQSPPMPPSTPSRPARPKVTLADLML